MEKYDVLILAPKEDHKNPLWRNELDVPVVRVMRGGKWALDEEGWHQEYQARVVCEFTIPELKRINFPAFHKAQLDKWLGGVKMTTTLQKKVRKAAIAVLRAAKSRLPDGAEVRKPEWVMS